MTNETHSYEDWKTELIRIAIEKTGQNVIDKFVNDFEAMEWYDSGWTPYYTFRETWSNECDS